MLKGKANVHRPSENTGPTILGLAHLNEYLATGTPAGEGAPEMGRDSF